MTPIIRLERIQWFDENPVLLYGEQENAYPECDGQAVYKVTLDNGAELSANQLFARGPTKDVRGQIVWGWDGNREAPSLTPSFDCDWGNVRAHLFLTKGKIELAGGSTVVLA